MHKRVRDFHYPILYRNIAIDKKMGLSKTEKFSESQNEKALLLRSLGHPARIAILEYLIQAGQCICTDIVNELPLAQATVSQHLKELKNAGLIKGNIAGTSICYCIDEEGISKLREYFQKLSSEYLKIKNQCC